MYWLNHELTNTLVETTMEPIVITNLNFRACTGVVATALEQGRKKTHKKFKNHIWQVLFKDTHTLCYIFICKSKTDMHLMFINM